MSPRTPRGSRALLLAMATALAATPARAEEPPAPGPAVPPAGAPAAGAPATSAPAAGAQSAPSMPSSPPSDAATTSPGPAPMAGSTASATASLARTGGATAVVLQAVTPVTDCTACPTIHRPDPERERDLATLARELDNVVVEAAQDLGLTLDVSERVTQTTVPPSESSLILRAKTSWVFSPRVALDGNRVVIRIVAVAPGSSVLLVRSEQLRREEVGVRAVLMMRDLVHAGHAGVGSGVPTPQPDERAVVHEARSPGRAVLALNAAVLGGYVGFALQRAGGSSDARLTYPLIALGTGLGLGSSMIVADEWDVGLGDAWYLSAGMWWPTIGALLAARNEPDSKRFLYGAGAAAGGLALATTSLTFGGISEGSALVAHSGGAFGILLGGIADLAVQGRTNVTPTEGMGVGAITGVVVTGALARFMPPQVASRVLLVDLSAGLGALTGAAVASPLVFGEDVGSARNRLWLSTIALGTFVGAGIGAFTTNSPAPSAPTARTALGRGGAAEVTPARGPLDDVTVLPYAGVIAATTKPDGSSVPVTGAGIQGTF